MINLVPRIEILSNKLLIGKSMQMSLVNDHTRELWSEMIPYLSQISHRPNKDLISLQVYPPFYYQNFDPSRSFEKWALVEVAAYDEVSDGLSIFELEGGTYAVFDYKGSSSDPRIFQYIFSSWLPISIYEVDDRPHFEVLGAKYKNNDPDSEEEIWIPIKRR